MNAQERIESLRKFIDSRRRIRLKPRKSDLKETTLLIAIANIIGSEELKQQLIELRESILEDQRLKKIGAVKDMGYKVTKDKP